MDTTTSALNPIYWLFDTRCIDLDWNGDDFFYNEVITMVLMPVGVVLLNLIVWTVGTVIVKCISVPDNEGERKEFSLDLHKLRNRVILTVGMWLYLVYPAIVGLLL